MTVRSRKTISLSPRVPSSLMFDPDHFLTQQGSLFPYEPRTLDEVVWPSANQLGIPDLDIDRQAENVPDPFRIWGESKRTEEMRGTYAFYTDDYKFTGLWRDPDKLLKSCCTAVVEANFSVRPRMPFPVAVYEIFRKRWLARYWQSQGVNVIVDMNVGPCWLLLNLVGVPKGWRAYATRAHTGERDVLQHVFDLCCHHAGTKEILFVVYGGGASVERMAQNAGWTWYPEKMHRERRKQKEIEYAQNMAQLAPLL